MRCVAGFGFSSVGRSVSTLAPESRGSARRGCDGHFCDERLGGRCSSRSSPSCGAGLSLRPARHGAPLLSGLSAVQLAGAASRVGRFEHGWCRCPLLTKEWSVTLGRSWGHHRDLCIGRPSVILD